jgi:hypothetical protein
VDAQDSEEGLGVGVGVWAWWWWWAVVVGGGLRGVVAKKAHLLRARLRSLLLCVRGSPPPFPREDKGEDQHEAGRDEEALGAECPAPPSLPRRGGGGPSASSRIARAWAATGRPRRIAPVPFNQGPSFVRFSQLFSRWPFPRALTEPILSWALRARNQRIDENEQRRAWCLRCLLSIDSVNRVRQLTTLPLNAVGVARDTCMTLCPSGQGDGLENH